MLKDELRSAWRRVIQQRVKRLDRVRSEMGRPCYLSQQPVERWRTTNAAWNASSFWLYFSKHSSLTNRKKSPCKWREGAGLSETSSIGGFVIQLGGARRSSASAPAEGSKSGDGLIHPAGKAGVSIPYQQCFVHIPKGRHSRHVSEPILLSQIPQLQL